MMKEKQIKSYIKKIKENNNLNISDYFLEKDYILSLFLSNWAKIETPNLDELIFKGGTLLTKNYLNYHRISEDLDFIHKDSNIIRKIKTKQKRETQIKKKIITILNEIKKITNISNLEFEVNRNDERYIIMRNSRSLYILKLYYKSIFTGLKSFIKFEISFVEDIVNKPTKQEIKNIIDYYSINEIDLRLINYNLIKPILQIYSIEEIILEKIRASITRIEFKPRDLFDLYLINKHKNIFNQEKEKIFRKLKASPFQLKDTLKNIKNFVNEDIKIDLDDIYNLSLININEEDFVIFSNKLIKYLKEIAKNYLKTNYI